MPSRMPFLVPDQNHPIILFCKCDGPVEYQTGSAAMRAYKDFPWRIWARNLISGQEYLLGLPSFPQSAIDIRPMTFKTDDVWNLIFVRRFKDTAGGHIPYVCKSTTQDWVTFSEPKRIFARISQTGFMNNKYILCEEHPAQPNAPVPQVKSSMPISRSVFLVERATGIRIDIQVGLRQITSCSWMPGDEEHVIISGIVQDGSPTTLILALADGSVKEVKINGSTVAEFSSFGNRTFYALEKDQSKIIISEGPADIVDSQIAVEVRRA